MATAEDCRLALESLTERLSHLDPAARATHVLDREISCTVTDLDVTFVARLGPGGASPVTEANGPDGPAQVRLTTRSQDLLALADDPGSFGRAWLTGRLKVEASLPDLLRLRKLL